MALGCFGNIAYRGVRLRAGCAKRELSLASASSRRHMLEGQSSLPRLPVPHLHESISLYLQSVRPLLNNEEFARTREVANQFMLKRGFGELWQKRLLDYDAQQKDSWLAGLWLKHAYLVWRCPTMLNVNWWCQFVDPPASVTDKSGLPLVVDKWPNRGFTPHQIKRAAGITVGLLRANALIQEGSLPVDHIKDTPLCMDQYTKLFGVTRIPKEGCDEIMTPYPAKASHIILLVHDQIFKVPVLGQNGSGDIPSVDAIAHQFQAAVEAAQESKATDHQPCVGMLTSEDRDVWARARRSLEKVEANQSTFKAIDDALFAVALDDFTLGKGTAEDTHPQIFHNNARNRWFDKALTLIVTNSGRAGINGEHSPSDAVVPGAVFNQILAQEGQIHAQASTNKTKYDLAPPSLLRWQMPSGMGDTIKNAEAHAQAAINALQSCILHTHANESGGSQWIKNSASVSPDSYAQLALQLAYFRNHSTIPATYESASTRAFRLGRTETVRTQSSPSKLFVEAFDRSDFSAKEKLALFQAAAAVHVKYMKSASQGRGCDRHLLGLKLLKHQNEPDHFFTDPSWSMSNTFKLSTSNMTPGKFLYGGFGAVAVDGYGCNYAVDADSFKFSVSAWKGSSTNAHSFRDTLKQSLEDLYSMVENARG